MPEILVIKPSSLGDIIHGLQVTESIRRQVPGMRVTWVVRDTFAPLVDACATVDDVMVFQRKGGVRGFMKLLKTIGSRRFEWVLDMQGLARSGLMTCAANCPKRHKLGRSDAREFSGWAYGQKIPMPGTDTVSKPPYEALDANGQMDTSTSRDGGHAHAIDILLEFLPMMGLQKSLSGKLQFKLPAPTPAIARAFDGPTKLPVVLFPSSRRPEKEWPGFAELAGRLLDACDHKIIWTDSQPIEAPDWAEKRFVNLSGQTSLTDMIRLVQSARLVICNDSGPMHLAAALGKPVVALFGPTAPERFGPYPLNAPGHHVITAPDNDLRQLAVGIVAEVVTKALNTA